MTDLSKDFNVVTFTFTFAPDKFSGLNEWQQDIRLLSEIAMRLNMNSGRRSMETKVDRDTGEDDLFWTADDCPDLNWSE